MRAALLLLPLVGFTGCFSFSGGFGRGWSPIIFHPERSALLKELLDEGNQVSFDLDGDEVRDLMSWVKPDTAILVWDPEQLGVITSGRQLFGSVTWGMRWQDGFEPLKTLDQDGDGWLAGQELRGLGMWVDANSNAVSEPGEVRAITSCRMVRISVLATHFSEGIPWNPEGIELTDGSRLPVYDWIVVLPQR